MKGAWPKTADRNGLVVKQTVNDFRGQTLAVDVAGWIHSALPTLPSGREWAARPRVPMTFVIEYVCKRALTWKQAGATLICLLECKRPQLKQAEEGTTRDAEREARVDAYTTMMALPLPTDEDEKIKRISDLRVKRKDAASITEDTLIRIKEKLHDLGVACMMCYREFDHQSVSLYHQGLVDGAMPASIAVSKVWDAAVPIRSHIQRLYVDPISCTDQSSRTVLSESR